MVNTGARHCRRGGQTRANSSPTGRRERYRARMCPGFFIHLGGTKLSGFRSVSRRAKQTSRKGLSRQPKATTGTDARNETKESRLHQNQSEAVFTIRRKQLCTCHTPVTHPSLPQTVVLFLSSRSLFVFTLRPIEGARHCPGRREGVFNEAPATSCWPLRVRHTSVTVCHAKSRASLRLAPCTKPAPAPISAIKYQVYISSMALRHQAEKPVHTYRQLILATIRP